MRYALYNIIYVAVKVRFHRNIKFTRFLSCDDKMCLQSYVAKQQLSFNMLSAYVVKYFSLVTTKPQNLKDWILFLFKLVCSIYLTVLCMCIVYLINV